MRIIDLQMTDTNVFGCKDATIRPKCRQQTFSKAHSTNANCHKNVVAVGDKKT